MLGIGALAVLAAIGKSAVMFVSAVAIGIIAYVFRQARARDRVVAIIVAGLGGSIGAEIVHTIYHYTRAAESGADSGGFFMSAIMVGLINAGAIIALLFVTEASRKIIDRKYR